MPKFDSSPETKRSLPILMNAYLDGELDVAISWDLQRQIEADPELAKQTSNLIALKKVLKDKVLPETISSGFHSRIRASIGASQRRPDRRPTWQALAASVLVAVLAASGGTWIALQADTKTIDVADAHMRSLVAAKPFDVASSERHVVLPWFAGKLPYAPKVADLSASGFPLVGARVDVIDTNPVSALVYNRRLHVINLFARPIATAYDTSIQQRTVKGYNVVSWREDGNEYWAISDLNAAELKSFTELFRTASGPVDPR